MHELPTALSALGAYSQFILWKAVPLQNGKTNKLPVDPRTLQVFKKGDGWQADPTAWADFATAARLVSVCGEGYGVGFFFTPSDPFFFLDIDKCLQDDGTWSPLATELCQRLAGAAVEVSQSGRGLHIFGTGRVPEHACKNVPLGLELYTQGRFVALTGTNAIGDAGKDCTATIGQIAAQYFAPSAGASATPAEWTDGPVPEWRGPADDDELIELMINQRAGAGSVFGGKATARDLWEANEDKLAAAYPDTEGDRPYDGSSADMALCMHLAYYTGKDCERMDRLMRRSALVRDKWTEREDYARRTVLGAVGLCKSVYGERPATDPMHAEPVEPVQPGVIMSEAESSAIREGFQFLGLTQQQELFAGCCYIRDIHRVFTPDGALLKPEQFKTTYGGFVFALDSLNDKITRNAWEAFTESQGVRFPKAHGLCFRPECPPGSMIEEEGRILLNSYVPVPIPRQKGDATPFLNHLAKLLPVRRDRDILLAYMAACVQYPGVKFQWCPLLQGMEGNGKTLIISCIANAVGQRYTHMPNAQDLGNAFNRWLYEKLFIGVEEVYVSDRREVLDALKPMITNDRIEIQGKGADQVTLDNRANFIMCSNHKDAILKTRTDRRFAVFYTAQQELADMEAAGMTGDYFPKLYHWLKREGGYAVVTDYLHTYQIPDELNPAGACHRAPVTSSTEEAVALSLGGVEQEIMEAVDEGRPGFSGGWISSMALDRLLESRRDSRRVPQNRRRSVLRSLGYDLHPHLPGGRANSVVPLDGGKPRLYIRTGHPDQALTKGSDIVAAYVKAQTGGDSEGDAARVFGG